MHVHTISNFRDGLRKLCVMQARRQAGLEGVRSNPPFDLQKILQLYILSVLPFESGLLVSLLSRITAVQTSLVTAMRVCSWRTSAKRARKLFTLLRWKDAREYTCVNKSLVLVLESCPSSDVTPPAVLPTLVPSLVEVQSQLAQQMHTWTAINGMQYFASHVSASVPKWSQKQSQSI